MQAMDQKVAVVTGGAMGIGAAAALALAKDGHQIVICDIKVDEAERFAGHLKDQGFSAFARQVDVSSPSS